MNYYPFFRVMSWNNGLRCMSFYILLTTFVHSFAYNVRSTRKVWLWCTTNIDFDKVEAARVWLCWDNQEWLRAWGVKAAKLQRHFLQEHRHDAVFNNDSSRPALAPKLCGCEYVPGWISAGTRGFSVYHRWKQDLQISGWSRCTLSNGTRLSRHVVLWQWDSEVLPGCHLPVVTRQTEYCPRASRILLPFHWHLRNR